MIEDTYGMENCPDSLYKSWANFKVAPMAGNIQLIFYRNPADADAPVMTKVMLNEREVRVPVDTDNFPFYRWDALKAHLVKMTETPFDSLVPDHLK